MIKSLPLGQRSQVIRYDVRGYGQSSLPTTEPYRHASDLKGLLDHLGSAHIALAGLSYGGRIAINVTLTYPELVQCHVYCPDWQELAHEQGR